MKRAFGPLLLAVCLCGGCQAPAVSFQVMRPDFAALLDLPELAGVVTVRDKDSHGALVGRANVTIDGETFAAKVPRLPLDRDLFVTLEWTSGGLTVAATAGSVVRVGAKGTTVLKVGAADYLFPDTDGDGAQDIFEVAFAANHPDPDKDPPRDAAVVPTGFFNRIGQSHPFASFANAATVDSAAGNLLVATFDSAAGSTFGNHAVQLVEPSTGYRYTTPIACPSHSSLADVVEATSERAAVLCRREDLPAATDNVIIVDPRTSGAPVIVRSVVTPGARSLFHAARANRVYAMATDSLYLIDLLGSTPFVDTIRVGDDVGPVALGNGVNLGDRLLLTDAVQNALIVVDSSDGSWSARRVLSGAFSTPKEIVVHPFGPRAYVANAGDGLLRVVDIADADPAQWHLEAVVPVGNQATALAIDPIAGSFLYATSAERLVRIDTVTNTVGWSLEPGGRNALGKVELSDDGRFGLVVNARTILTLDYTRDVAGAETEPNQQPGDSANGLAVPGSSFGWVDTDDVGSLSTTWTWTDDSGQLQQHEDHFEDVWSLEPAGPAERLAVAVVPGFNYENIAVALVDTAVRDTAFYMGSGVASVMPGNGVLLLTPPLAIQPSGLSVAVSLLDQDQGFGPYEVVVVGVPAVIATVAEDEPNDSWDTAQRVGGTLPVEVAGIMDSADVGVGNGRAPPNDDDFEDCFRVALNGRRLAVRLQPTPSDLDLNLLPYDASSQRLAGSFYWVREPGAAEYLILTPRTGMPEVMLCVGVRDSDAVTQGDYRLLIVDLGA